MRKKLFYLCFLISLCPLLICTTWEINQDGSADFITIREGISVSEDYDTVLVHPGIYYENLNMTGKNITLASLEMTTGNLHYINSTIIDGQMQGSCIILHNITLGAVIRGFTIRNGFGTFLSSYDGGGVQIQCVENGLIKNCCFANNHAALGGAIFSDITTLTLSGLKIFNNFAEHGGAAFFDYGSEITFDPINRCNIYNNNGSKGADLFAQQTENIHVVVDTFSVLSPDRFFAEYFNGSTYTFDIQHNWMELTAQDLYVASDGDDNNTGFTPDEPLKTIAWAVRKIAADSLEPHTVYVAAGNYSWAENQQIFPIGCKEYVSLIGEDMNTTILRNDFSLRVVNGYNLAGYVKISNFTLHNDFIFSHNIMDFRRINFLEVSNIIIDGQSDIRNIIFSEYVDNLFDNIIITNNVAEINAGFQLAENTGIIRNCVIDNNSLIQEPFFGHISSILVDAYDQFIIENTIISNSTTYDNASYTLGLYNSYGTEAMITMTNCLITGNNNSEKVMCVSGNGEIEINNCTIADNNSNWMTIEGIGDLTLRNTIMHNNTNYEIYMIDDTANGYTYELDVENCNVKNGINGIHNVNNANIINWGTENISDNPLFDCLNDYPYTLQEGSVCIDSGTPDTTGLFLPPWDLLNNLRICDGNGDGIAIIDMGCYEFREDSLGINYDKLPVLNYDLRNYPNPLNPETTISFYLRSDTDVKLSIYNFKGQKINTLINKTMDSGHHRIIWDGTDANKNQVSCGIYFYRFTADNHSLNKKLLLLK